MVSTALLRAALEAAWGPDTCYPDSSDRWRPENPSRNQCGMTALVVHDLLGGEIILGDVEVQGRKKGNHYWNRLPDGTELDFTADQFLTGEVTANGRVVTRPSDAPRLSASGVADTRPPRLWGFRGVSEQGVVGGEADRHRRPAAIR